MIKKPSRDETRLVRHRRVRRKISGDAGKPRLSVFRSQRHIYAQVIDDATSRTLVSANSLDKLTLPVAGAPKAEKADKAEKEVPRSEKGKKKESKEAPMPAQARAVSRLQLVARAVGELLAKRALEKGITEVVFDRGGFSFHGRVKALADGARQAGLKF